ncbi:MAG: PfkB family carbohydrate kinase [Clostridiales Family XIII bacterium]|jgi:sugar/nucleoside kinase (ribokinase family)|nr:PfkB family carbohydrate kinase [Clostridiales Family XIII bacterium]
MLKAVGLGDNVVDQYLHRNIMYPGGNAVNVAVYAKELDAAAAYVGVFGNDRAGRHIHDVLTEIGIDLTRCRTENGENGYSAVDLVDGDRTYIGGNDGGVGKTHPLRLDAEDLEYLTAFDLIHTSCYSHIEPELEKLSKLRALLSFDFSDRFTDAYADKLCPFIDIGLISCGAGTDEDVANVAKKAHAAGCRMVLCSRGKRGATLSMDGRAYAQPAKKIKAVDTLGAGDAFFTAFILNYLGKTEGALRGDAEETIAQSLRIAADFATKICMRDGAFGYGIPLRK